MGKPMVALTWPKAWRQGGATVAGGGGRWGPRRRRPSEWWTKPRPPGNSGRRDGALVTRAWHGTHWGRRSPRATELGEMDMATAIRGLVARRSSGVGCGTRWRGLRCLIRRRFGGWLPEDVRGLSGRHARTPAEIAALIQYA
uniref:Uncharacterized protein n=1 Tax=Arundo donax TaxID=35708 RepID=A0A0A9F061_ARUDO